MKSLNPDFSKLNMNAVTIKGILIAGFLAFPKLLPVGIYGFSLLTLTWFFYAGAVFLFIDIFLIYLHSLKIIPDKYKIWLDKYSQTSAIAVAYLGLWVIIAYIVYFISIIKEVIL